MPIDSRQAAPWSPEKLSDALCLQGQGSHLGSKASEVLQVTADSVGFLDNGVDVQLGNFLHEAIFITLPVLEH